MFAKIIVMLLLIIFTNLYISNIFSDKRKHYFAMIFFMIIVGINLWLLIKMYGWSYTTFAYILLIYSLYLISLVDIQYKIIPNEIIVINVIIGIILSYLNPNMKGIYSILTAIAIFIILLIFNKIFKEVIGLGDIYLFSVLTLLLGFKIMLGIFMTSIILSGIFGFFLLIIKKATKNTRLAFSPFILCSTILIILL